MLAACLLTHALRAARQRAPACGLVAAATAAWQLLQTADLGASCSSSSSGSGSSQWLRASGTCSSASFGSSTLASGAAREARNGEAVSGSKSKSKSTQLKGAGGRLRRTAEPQPQLQAWLQQEQGLPAADAKQHARRLALVFGSQQAALDGLPVTFEWCRSHGLTGLQTAQLLDRIAKKRPANVVHFAALVQPVWQLIDSYIAAHIEPLRQAGARLPKHTSLAEVLCCNSKAADALGMPPGHVDAWLAAVGQRLPAVAVGCVLLSNPLVVSSSPSTALAAISWAADELGAADLAAFFARGPSLLITEAANLQRNLDSLQQALGWTAEQARQQVLGYAALVGMKPGTVQAAAAWLRQLFPDAAQLADVLSRSPQLLTKSVQHLQGNADTLRQALGWQDGNSQLAAFVAAYPQPFAINDFSSECTAHKLRLLTQVVGVSMERCLAKGTGYLKTGLESMAADYILVQDHAPHVLVDRFGGVPLSWIVSPQAVERHCGISREQRNAFVREWPRSEAGRRLLERLRAGSVARWPRPPVPGAAQQRQREEAAQRRQARAGRQQGTAGAMDGKRRGRGRRSGADQGSSAAGDGESAA